MVVKEMVVKDTSWGWLNETLKLARMWEVAPSPKPFTCLGKMWLNPTFAPIPNIPDTFVAKLGHSREIFCFYHPHWLPDSCTLHITIIEAFEKHARNLVVAVSLSKQLCFYSVPAHTEFQPFLGWETGYFSAMALYNSVYKWSHIVCMRAWWTMFFKVKITKKRSQERGGGGERKQEEVWF